MSNVLTGTLRKLRARHDTPVSYTMPVGSGHLDLNAHLGRPLNLSFTGNIYCIHCGRKTSKSFNQGFCYPCFQALAQCDSCIMAPEKCHYHAGTCREPVWGEEHCMQDHIVYLANSSGLKVGITRASQVPVRWIDQGAVQALAVLRVRTRQQSGFAEHVFRQHITDRTNWRAMLRDETDTMDLLAERDRLLTECRQELDDLRQQFGLHAISEVIGVEPVHISYPVLKYPTRLNSFNLDKDSTVEGTLLGIKGQYLILDTGVINIRKYTAYEVEVAV